MNKDLEVLECPTTPRMPAVAYAYVPIQQIGSVYSSEEALSNGTLFPELNLPLGAYGCRAFSERANQKNKF